MHEHFMFILIKNNTRYKNAKTRFPVIINNTYIINYIMYPAKYFENHKFPFINIWFLISILAWTCTTVNM